MHSFLLQSTAQAVTTAAQAGVDGADAQPQRGGDFLDRLQQIVFAQKDFAVRRVHCGHQLRGEVSGFAAGALEFRQLAERLGKAVVKRKFTLPPQRAVAVDTGVAGCHSQPAAQRRTALFKCRGIAPQRDKHIGHAFFHFACVARQDVRQHPLDQRGVNLHSGAQPGVRVAPQQADQRFVIHKAGKPTSNSAIYGYKKDPEDKDHWLVDEEAAAVVRRIFRLAVEGHGPYEISKMLTAEKVECPGYYLAKKRAKKKKQGKKSGTSMLDKNRPYDWYGNTVSTLLERPEYMGHVHADYIITRNLKDFTQSRVMAFTPSELLARI